MSFWLLIAEQMLKPLHNNLYCVDVDYPTKKEILAYFEVVEKTLRGLRNAVNLRQSEIEVQLERIKYSLF